MNASKALTFDCLLVVSVNVHLKAASKILEANSLFASLLMSAVIQAGFLWVSYLQQLWKEYFAGVKN